MPIDDTTTLLQNGQLPPNFDSLPMKVREALLNTVDSINRIVQAKADASNNEYGYRLGWEILFASILFVLLIFWKEHFFRRLQELDRKKFALFFIVVCLSIILSIYYNTWPFTLLLLIALLAGLVIFLRRAGHLPEDDVVPIAPEEAVPEKVLRYEGDQLGFSIPTLHATLNERWPYFSALAPLDKDKFGTRLKKFIDTKTYDIYDDRGFVEMPILISAAAIQITFGLEEYLLPDFPVINIYPDGFFKANPFPRFLEGNVSNGCINLSWKHFLIGIQCYSDGDNVGLHEMAHALYSQSVLDEAHRDPYFCKTYEEFNDSGTKVFQEGKTPDDHLYSDYAFKNIQEFWAVSVELFFEESVALKAQFPLIYNALVDILNQDPSNKLTVVK